VGGWVGGWVECAALTSNVTVPVAVRAVAILLQRFKTHQAAVEHG
jgi:hypothetical protein